MDFFRNPDRPIERHTHAGPQHGGKLDVSALEENSGIAVLDGPPLGQDFTGGVRFNDEVGALAGIEVRGGITLTTSGLTIAFDDGSFSLTLRIPTLTGNQDLFLPDASGTLATGAAGVSSTSVAFTDGDTYRRVTVTDAAVTSTSKIVGTIVRPNSTDDTNDAGLTYVANVVRRATGEFDLLVRVEDFGGDEPEPGSVNETVTYCYTVG